MENKTTIIQMRTTPERRQELESAADEIGLSVSELLRQIVPPEVLPIIVDKALACGLTPKLAMLELLANGLRYAMAKTSHPMATQFLAALTDVAVVESYSRWADAAATSLGLTGPLGNRWAFVSAGESGTFAIEMRPTAEWGQIR